MRREANRGTPLILYALAAPVYFVRGVLTLLRLFRLWRISRLGYVDCPHCGTENAIDVLGYCPKCRTSEYGNRLRCMGCGTFSPAFPCDRCGVTIHCL